jgi:hypothetical protein
VKFHATWEDLLDAFAIAVAVAGAWLAWTRARQGALVAAALAAAAAGVPFLLAIAGEDYLNTRNVIAACLPFLLVIAAGYGAARRAIAVAGTAALAAVGIAATAVIAADADYQRSDFRGAAEALGPPRGARAVVVPSVAGEIAFGRYLHGLARMPAAGVAVTEVAMVTPRSSKLAGKAVARPALPPALPRPFRLVQKSYSQTYTLVRYRAPRAVRLTPALLAREAAPVVFAPLVLVQR